MTRRKRKDELDPYEEENFAKCDRIIKERKDELEKFLSKEELVIFSFGMMYSCFQADMICGKENSPEQIKEKMTQLWEMQMEAAGAVVFMQELIKKEGKIK